MSSRSKPTSYKNEFLDHTNGDEVEILGEDKVKRLQERLDTCLTVILKHTRSNSYVVDTTIYTGDGGVCTLLLRLYETTKNEQYLIDASHYLDKVVAELPQHVRRPEKEVSFIEGFAGSYSIACVTSHFTGNHKNKQFFMDKLLSFAPLVFDESMNTNELLFGRTGYIHALLFVFRHTQDVVLIDTAEKVANVLVHVGRSFAGKIGSKSPLMYEWHEKRYLGMAHGLTGILYVLLLLSQHRVQHTETHPDYKGVMDGRWWEDVRRDVRGSVDFVSSTVFPSGNYPTRDDGTEDRLVQWCHGAVAPVFMFCKAYEVFKDAKYIKLAEAACDVVWERGLLRKGLGLCHGISGNAYALLSTYKVTKNSKFLHRAVAFSEFGWNDSELLISLISTPDEPYSLFNGIGGAVYLYNDLLQLSKDKTYKVADFPTLEL